MSTTSASLVIRLRNVDDESAWRRFVQLYSPLLHFWACKTGLRSEDAADLVQDVLLVLMRKLPEFEYDAGRSFRGWLRTVTLNKCRDHLRRKQLEVRDDASHDLREIAVGNEVELLSEQEYRQHLVARALEIMQREFQPTTWQACWEHVVRGRPAAEVAAELGMSVNAVYLAKSRVMRHLRQELDGLLS